ncbi:pepsin/retropepsin-like aspartic protease family protein [Serratia fonticola]|uniref:hypothetical protein n=1 Tax=Serratia fonticola TaxID=47917 RepID=UPI002DBE7294|nr:hypothetical protein [Serratia fonticola]MEB7884514.1 retropepsin-like domain-containing protein [Serratia fonticola]
MYKHLVFLGAILCQSSFAKTISLPIIFTGEYNMPHIELNLNGTPQLFMLDTGSRESLHISQAMMASIPNLALTGKKQRSTDLAGNLFENNQFVIKEISINGMIFKDIYGVELQPWGLSFTFGEKENDKDTDPKPKPEVPVIGLDFFHDHIVTIDYANKVLIVDDNQDKKVSIKTEGMHKFPFILSEEGVLISINDGVKDYVMGIDTGASTTVIRSSVLSPKTAREPCSKMNPEWPSEDCTVIALQMPSLKLKEPIYAVVLEEDAGNFENAGLLGTNFLERFLVTMDMKNKALLLKPIE